VLTAQLAPGREGGFRVRAVLQDLAGHPGPARSDACSRCDRPAALLLLGRLARDVVVERAAPTVPLRVTSDRPGDAVRIDGRPAGATPYAAAVPAGDHEVEVRRRGVGLYQTEARVDRSGIAIDVGTQVAPRPRWRIALGTILGAGGAVLLSYGAFYLSIHGRCVGDCVPEGESILTYNTRGAGSGMLASGAALMASGLSLALTPGPRRLERRPGPALARRTQ
jgi:hypothetical protein